MAKRRDTTDTCCSIFPDRKTCPLCGETPACPPWTWPEAYGNHAVLDEILADPENDWYEDAVVYVMEQQFK